jgi:hypothetical protein
MVQSSSGVNDARRTTNPVSLHHITEDLSPQECQNTCLELGRMLKSAIHFSTCLPSPSLSVYRSLLLTLLGIQELLREGNFVFSLTPQQVTDILGSGDFEPGTKREYMMQVL